MFPLHGLSFDLWLEVMDTTLILGEETFKKPGRRWIYSISAKFDCDNYDQPGVLLIMRQKSWIPPSRNLRHCSRSLEKHTAFQLSD